ncbi:hypothetical protein ACQW02_21945 [Humitalea sp. 24SJ18S-53]|uniref:hypothetical protein n=1 Tax=Humitalea sp. 24SJ18S-53 TaxID=3422307 RepID=UPI003D66A5BB
MTKILIARHSSLGAAFVALVALSACAPQPMDRATLSEVRVTTPAPATCVVTRNGAVTYRLTSTPATIPAGSLSEASVIACSWTNTAGAVMNGTSVIGNHGFHVGGPGEIVFPPS